VRRALAGGSLPDPPVAPPTDALVDDDLHLALHVLEDLAYRVGPDQDRALTHQPDVVAYRDLLRTQFWDAVVADAGAHQSGRWADLATTVGPRLAVAAMLDDFDGPSLSQYAEDHASRDQLAEFMIHRSAYQLREADPHTFAIPRLAPGPRKSA